MLLCCMQVFGSGNLSGSGVQDSAFIQELEAAYTAAVSRQGEGDCNLAEALLNKEEVGTGSWHGMWLCPLQLACTFQL